ncbi:tetratricopeptide repeat protein [Bradyrhizobium acaciae]|uniref:tetratricopeptide repeat protein n=1 Tax=Bradyrhizobium acaciae TaxID=2683706 RepID=UPI001E2A29D8|nr:tetratricopeptide repeat protein [Bradyrhizobium acaciae]MCC8978669.1 sel1 repeat family protein [Bradyrhizobium acaciae]
MKKMFICAVVLLWSFSESFAQNGQMQNGRLLPSPPPPPVTSPDSARGSWERLPPAELACAEKRFVEQGTTLNDIITRVIGPDDLRVADVRFECSLQPQGGSASPPPETTVTACDQYAASDLDDKRLGPGVSFDKIDRDLAIPACRDAVKKYPTTPRFWFQLGRAYLRSKNETLAIDFYRKAVNANYPVAFTALGRLYYSGQKFDEAFRLLSRAAAQGSALAQSNVGNMYFNGQGVTKDEGQAAAWFRKSADQGYSEGQHNLGVLYENGRGVQKDLDQAVAWLQKAATQGYEPSRRELDKIREAQQQKEAASKAQIEYEEALKNMPKRDPEDVVAQVLNYSRFGKDNGADEAYFTRVDKCAYRLVRKPNRANVAGTTPDPIQQALQDPLTGGDDLINLDELDPRLISFQSGAAGRLLAPLYQGASTVATVVRYDTKPMIYTLEALNEERLQRGWGLIYERYCTGKRKAF